MLLQEFKEKEHQLVNGVVQQVEGSNFIIDIGKTNGIMMPVDQVAGEKYNSGQRLKIYINIFGIKRKTTQHPR